MQHNIHSYTQENTQKNTLNGSDLHLKAQELPVSYTHLTLPTNREV